jgi:hypothetical protein
MKKDVNIMKNLIKTLLLPMLAAGLLLSACAQPASQLSYTSDSLVDVPPTIAELAKKSDLIVTGTVTSAGETWNIARGVDPTTTSTAFVVMAQNFVLTVDGTLKGTAGSQVTWAVAKGDGAPASFPVTDDANWTPPTIGARYLLFLVKIPGTEIYGIPAEPSRFRLDAVNARSESRYSAATQKYPAMPAASLLGQVRSAVARP